MMTSCKVVVCLTMTLVALIRVESSAIDVQSALKDSSLSVNQDQRSRRSSKDSSSEEGPPDFGRIEDLAGYRFGDEFFNHPAAESAQATESEISRLENGKKPDGCERVVKDSMICMLCKDPGTNSKYEQCSYVARPKERSQSYLTSRSYTGKPEAIGKNEAASQVEEEKPEVPSYDRYSNDHEDDDREATDEAPSGAYTYGGESQRYANEDGDDGDSDDEKYQERESNPSSASLYRSQFGSEEDRSGKVERDDSQEDYERDEPGSYNERLGQSSYEVAHRRAADSHSRNEEPEDESGNQSRERSNADKKKGHCREIQKDSMTCTVCTDPENGGNFEKCSYSHQPNDKLYKYSKSKRFGYPTETNEEASSYPEETRVLDVVDNASNKNDQPKNTSCRKVRKNPKTVCTICKDTKTGGNSEECEYNLKSEPSRRTYRTNSSKS